ncbi:MAG: hypothetical protein MJA29_02600, partial [Candidatus Omnitrophica bacterium]|nr:hypothetical protein [Candidatus Omnitrophota bacterium]
GINKEMYALYMHKIDVFKLNFRTGTHDLLYHEDINRDIKDAPTYRVEAHCNVADNGIASLYKQGQQIDRQLWLYFSRKGLEDALKTQGFDEYRDVPTDGDVVKIQDTYWEIITVDPEGFHMNDRRFPFDFQANIVPWQRSAIPKDETRKEFKRY